MADDNFDSSLGVFRQMFDLQTKLAQEIQDSWRKSQEKKGESSGQQGDNFEFYEKLLQGQKHWYDSFVKFDFDKIKQRQGGIWHFMDVMGRFSPWGSMSGDLSSFEKLFSLFVDSLKQWENMPGVKSYQEQVAKLGLDSFDTFLKLIPGHFQMPMPDGGMLDLDITKDFLADWSGVARSFENFLQEQPDIWRRFLEGDHQAFVDSYAIWWKSAKELNAKRSALGKLGLNREFNEEVREIVEEYGDYTGVHIALLSEVFLCALQALEVLAENIDKLTAAGKQLKSSKELYDMWLQVSEQHFQELLKTRSFARLQAKYLKGHLALQSKRNKLAGYFLKNSPVATKDELDAANLEIYRLKKEVRVLQRLVKENITPKNDPKNDPKNNPKNNPKKPKTKRR